ncbi:hypothetical protein BKK50_09025 [Rodentibacter rarus]|uniref:Uncharacterized protein n=1 Tax=Rodentibacter rarus TaxID=1908260 RepID=A0A1V3IJ17_9PAST|nr:hypothetical protein [Rodentibacter rarus]OOF41024.1 hypothetical protein BKK50_09025 [Rodentibacter rarus]
MGVRTRMRVFVRGNLSGLTDEDVESLTDLILNAIGYTPRFFMPVSEIDKFENRFKEKFYKIFKEYKTMTRYDFFLIKKKIESESVLLKA